MVDEFENRIRFSSSGSQEPVRAKTMSPPTSVPHGVVPSCEVRNRHRSCVSGLQLPPRRLNGLAVFRGRRDGAEAPTPPMDLDLLQGTPNSPRRCLPTPATLMSFRAPTTTSEWGSTGPGFHTRFVPPSGFLTLLTVCSPQLLPISKIGAVHGVHPAELFPLAEPYAFRRRDPLAVSDIEFFCSEDQEITMPRGFRAFLSARIRIRSGSEDPADRYSLGF